VTDASEASHGWCSLRVRFDERELELLKGAEQLRGSAYAHTARPEVLRTALSLARAGHKIGAASAGNSVSLEEGELQLLVEALRFASQEVQWVTRAQNGQDDTRSDAVLGAFPELIQKGVWRSFGLVRELEALTARLGSALKA
jgi:hypothetical protein